MLGQSRIVNYKAREKADGMSTLPVLQVVAGLIEHNRKILICQRKPGGRHPLKWEFPGGKVEPGEDPAAALERELHEELGIDAEIGPEIAHYDVRYGDGPILHLHFFAVKEFRGELRNLDFAQIAWVDRAALTDYDFLDGDVAFVRQLSFSQSLP